MSAAATSNQHAVKGGKGSNLVMHKEHKSFRQTYSINSVWFYSNYNTLLHSASRSGIIQFFFVFFVATIVVVGGGRGSICERLSSAFVGYTATYSSNILADSSDSLISYSL